MHAPRALFEGLFDYAGLFPPAELQMRPALQHYAAYRRGRQASLLGRFVLPILRLEEFERAFSELPAKERGAGTWRLSVLGGRNVDVELHRILEFNRRCGDVENGVRIEAFELKLRSVEEVRVAADQILDPLEACFEVPILHDPQEWLAAIAESGGRAKVRTGGVTADMFPSVGDLARFLVDAAAARVPFKATAGLHHPVRSRHKLTPESHEEPVLMHGVWNLIVAAALARAGQPHEVVTQALAEESAEAFSVKKAGLAWQAHKVDGETVASLRQFLLTLASCSFEEPIAGLKEIGVL